MSLTGLSYLSELEGGMRLTVYLDSAGYETVGVGHLVMDDDGLVEGETITKVQGLEFLAEDVREAEDAVSLYVTVPLTRNQLDALCCLAFNIGVGAFRKSTLVRLLNEGDYVSVPAQMERWNRAGGKVQKGLQKRRRETAELWTDGNYERDWHPLEGEA